MAETKKTTDKNDKVTIRLPRVGKNDADVFVSVNEKTWLIKRGVEVEVPASVAEVLRNAELMEEEAYNYNNSVQK